MIRANELQDLVRDGAAIRYVCRLQPAGGPGDKIFPPTYKDAKYAKEKRRMGDEVYECVHLDSVQSQANRMELALLDAIRSERIKMPLLEVKFPPADSRLEKVGSISLLEAPHRMADAIFRDSELDGVRFRDSSIGALLDDASLANATGLFEYSPNSLVFGLWDSTGPMGGMGAKFQRIISSEVVAFGVEYGVKTSSRIDPLEINLKAGPVYIINEKTKEWTLSEASEGGKKRKPFGKDGKPSEINHGNIVPTIEAENGGVTFEFAQQVVVISMPALRRLRFPVNGKLSMESDEAARAVLAAIAILGTALTTEKGMDLRTRTLLIPEEEGKWQAIKANGRVQDLQISPETAIELYNECVEAAQQMGLPYHLEHVELAPSRGLLELVRRSQEIQITEGEE